MLIDLDIYIINNLAISKVNVVDMDDSKQEGRSTSLLIEITMVNDE